MIELAYATYTIVQGNFRKLGASQGEKSENVLNVVAAMHEIINCDKAGLLKPRLKALLGS